MLSTQTAQLLARYRAWADALTYRAVEGLPADESTKLRSTEFKSIIGTLNHIYVVDRVWQAHIEGRDHGFKTRNLIVQDRKSTRLNSSHRCISYAVFCLKKKTYG